MDFLMGALIATLVMLAAGSWASRQRPLAVLFGVAAVLVFAFVEVMR